MCVVSNIGDMGRQIWSSPFGDPYKPSMPYNPGIEPYDKWIPKPGQTFIPEAPKPYNGPTREQFEEYLTMLRAAKKLDELMGVPDCKQDEKLEWLKAIANHLGVPVPQL